MSGQLAACIRKTMIKIGLAGTAQTVRDVDYRLKTVAIVATSDGNVIDAAFCALDIPAEIARKRGITALLL
jgi:hypothetical protein